MEAVLQKRAPAIGACFGPKGPTGSLRVMLEIGVGGEVGMVRSGGLGDAKGEACVTELLRKVAVVTPIDEHVEVACDLARGDARPWRLALDSYGVIEVEPTQLRHGEHTLVPGGAQPESLPVNTYVVVAQPDTPGGMLQAAMMWVADAYVLMLAVRDGAGPPTFLGIADTGADSDAQARASLRVNKTTVTACANGTTHEAKLADLGPLVHKLADTCRSRGCAPALFVGIDSDAVARDLIEVASAARRAGFARVLFQTSDAACIAAPKPQRPRRPTLDIDLE
jgi:hypothetical protein